VTRLHGPQRGSAGRPVTPVPGPQPGPGGLGRPQGIGRGQGQGGHGRCGDDHRPAAADAPTSCEPWPGGCWSGWVANLVENAVRHNRPGGWVEVDTGRAGPLVVVRVANGGPHPPDQVATLFEPFRRLGADRTGSDRGAGLGLSIVKAVAAAHGGLEVTVELRR
jgi:hypothetical protein